MPQDHPRTEEEDHGQAGEGDRDTEIRPQIKKSPDKRGEHHDQGDGAAGTVT